MDRPIDPTRETSAAEDRALMAQVQSGDEAAFGALMARWELPTKAVIGRLVLNASEAEDLAQETFVRVWQKRAKFRPGAEFRPWLFAIAINLARNRLRWWRRRPTVSLDAWSISEGETSSGGREWRTGSPAEKADPKSLVTTGARLLELDERAAAVRDAIASLPHDLREAITLFEYEQLSHAEIAAVVGATPKAVETRIHRARERLRGKLQRWA